MTAPASTLYTNCTIITAGSALPRAQAMLTVDGTISAIGDRPDVENAADRTTHRVDLGGATIVPGFNDCHMHVLSLGLTLKQIDLRNRAAPSIAAILELVAARASLLAAGEWVLGHGYNQNLLSEGRHPDRNDLDSVSGGHPVLLGHTSGHVVTVNSAALDLAGITRNTADPSGGEIERDAGGNPTGVLKETARELVYTAMPPLTAETMQEAIVAASRALAVDGMTSASDAATGQHAAIEREIAAYQAALASSQLKTRLVLMPVIQQITAEAGAGTSLTPKDLKLGSDPEWLTMGATKIFSDGAMTTRTAAMREPYSDGGCGLLTWEPSQLRKIIKAAATQGWQIATHAIGDRAVEEVVIAYESTSPVTPPRRHRIEHCTICDRDLILRMKRQDIVPVLQPEDIAVLGDAYPTSIGDERAKHNSPVTWFIEAGLPVAFSSDRPVTPGHPLVGIRAAVERATAGGKVLGAEHQVDAETAIRYYTAGGAYATWTEHFKGTLQPGHKADFVVLDRDITKCSPEEITEARILRTVVNGSAVYEAG